MTTDPTSDDRPLCRVVTDTAGLDALEASWRRLETGASLFCSWEWMRSWWRHYGEDERHGRSLYVIVVERAGAVIGIAPLHRSASVLLGRPCRNTLRFIGRGADTAPDDQALLAAPADRQAVARALTTHLVSASNWSRLRFDDLPADDAWLDELTRAFGSRVTRRIVSSRRVAPLPDSIDSWRAVLSRNSRKHLSRRRRQAEAAGNLEFLDRAGDDVRDATLEALASLHAARRQAGAASASSAFASEPYRALQHEMAARLAARGALRLIELRLDGETVGIEYAFVHDGALCFYQTAFDPTRAALSPGHLLVVHLIERAIGEGIDRLDMLKGNYDYKASYAADTVDEVALDISRSRPVAMAVRLVDRWRARSSRQRSR